CFPEPPPFPLSSSAPSASPPSDQLKWVAFVSGMNLAEAPDTLAPSLLFDYLAGFLGPCGPPEAPPQAVCKVFFLGGLFFSRPSWSRPADALDERLPLIDRLCAELAATVPVDVMPASSDPSNYQFPHQPFNACLFPTAARLSTFSPVTNPHRCAVDSREILCESGDVIDGLAECSSVADPLVHLQNLLRWRHILPIAPDVLPCHPFTERDPFLLATCPHIFAVGGSDASRSMLWTNPSDPQERPILLLTVPRFEIAGEIVLVELNSLQTKSLRFSHPIPVDDQL
ncbi:MAG: hypothetical protein Q8P67_21580, partial [archaeon]|nr:hypothetical protein [archaeon]